MVENITIYPHLENIKKPQPEIGQIIENIGILKADLSSEEWDAVTDLQKSLCQEFSQDGRRKVEYLGRDFIALPGVFPPRPDSLELVQNMKIKPGDQVLDVCSGSGVVGIFAALKGAAKVVELELNEQAVLSAQKNAKLNEVENKVDVRHSDMFAALKPIELFDVVTMNPPFRDLPVDKMVQRTMWDQGFSVHRKFLSEVEKHIKPQARIYMAQANFGDLDALQKLLAEFKFKVRLLGRRPLEGHEKLVFYAFELIKDKADKTIAHWPNWAM